MGYRLDPNDASLVGDEATRARSVQRPGPAEDTGQNRTRSARTSCAPYNATAAISPAFSTTVSTSSPNIPFPSTPEPSPKRSPSTKTRAKTKTPKRPAKAGRDYSRSRLPGSRQKATAPPPPADGIPDTVAHAVEMGVEQPDLHRRTGSAKLKIDPKASPHKLVLNAVRRSRVMSQALALADVFYSDDSLAREERLLASQVATILSFVPDMPTKLDTVPIDGAPLQTRLQRWHACVYAALNPIAETIARQAETIERGRRRERQRDAADEAARAMMLDAVAVKPELRPMPQRVSHGGYPARPQVKAEQLYVAVPRDAHLRPVDRLIARKAPGLLSPRLSPEELAKQYPLASWRDHGERDRVRSRTEPPTNLSIHKVVLASLDPADPSAIEVVTAYLSAAFHHDPERDVPGFKAALRGLYIAWCWHLPQYAEHKTARARIDVITADWSSALAKPADRSDMARWHAYRSVLVHAAGPVATDQMMTASGKRTDEMRAWFGRYATKVDPALRQLLVMVGMLDAV